MPNLFFIKDIKKSSSSCSSFGGKKKYIATADLQNGKIVNYEVVDFNSKPSRANLIADNGSVIFAKMQNTIKVLEIDNSNVDNIYSTGFYSFKDERILPSYMRFFFESTLFNTIKDKNCQGATMKAINDEGMSKISINVPSIQFQQKIIDELSKITELINLNKNNLVNLDNIVKSQFIEMFGTLDLSEERKEWIEIKDVSKIYTGTTPSTADETNWDGDILWITPAEMNSYTFFVYDTVRKISEKGKRSKSLDLMPINTVLLSTRAPIGKVGIVGVPMTCNQGFKNFECCDKLNPIYLYTLLKNNTEYLNSLGSGTTFLEVSKSTISKLRIPLPDIKLQNKFADFVQLIDKSKYFGGVCYGIC